MRPLELIPDWVANNPTRHDGGSWLGFTGALLFHACGMQTSWLDVNSARMRSTIIGHDPKTAPSGAFHWWQYHAGQAALDIDGGGTRLLTATMAPNEWVAPGVGYIRHEMLSHLNYYGWSLDYAGERVPVRTPR